MWLENKKKVLLKKFISSGKENLQTFKHRSWIFIFCNFGNEVDTCGEMFSLDIFA